MEKRRILAIGSSQRGLGINTYLVAWLMLDRLQPPGWVWGAIGSISVLFIIATVAGWLMSDKYEIAEDGQLAKKD